MAACEICWAKASHRALLGQGFTADLYREEMAANPDGHEVGRRSNR